MKYLHVSAEIVKIPSGPGEPVRFVVAKGQTYNVGATRAKDRLWERKRARRRELRALKRMEEWL